MRTKGSVCLGLWVLAVAALTRNTESLAAHGPRWACWYDPSALVISCLLVRSADGNPGDARADIARRLDPRLPPHLVTLWGAPQALSGRRVDVPLWNVPYDMQDAERLADSVVCGLRVDCSVRFDPNPDDRARDRAGAPEPEVIAGATVSPASSQLPPAASRRRIAAR